MGGRDLLDQHLGPAVNASLGPGPPSGLERSGVLAREERHCGPGFL
jgi:hypothetical protein